MYICIYVYMYICTIQNHPGHKKGEAKSEAPVNVKITLD